MDHLGFTFSPRVGALEFRDQGILGQLTGKLYMGGAEPTDRIWTFPQDRPRTSTCARPTVKDLPLFTGISIVCTPPDVFTLSGLSWLGMVRTACWALAWLEWIFNSPKIRGKIRPSGTSDASFKFLLSLAFLFSHARTFLGHLSF